MAFFLTPTNSEHGLELELQSLLQPSISNIHLCSKNSGSVSSSQALALQMIQPWHQTTYQITGDIINLNI